MVTLFSFIFAFKVEFSHRNYAYAISVVKSIQVDWIDVFENLLCQGCEIKVVKHVSNVDRIKRFSCPFRYNAFGCESVDFVL